MSLIIENITKAFSGIPVLKGISMEFLSGKVHAVCGENGAGKSTLMNILSGNIRQDSGSIFLNGEPVVFPNPRASLTRGISIVHQHLSLVESMSVAENIYVGNMPANSFGIIDFKELLQRCKVLLASLKIEVDPNEIVANLSPSQKQLVEIAKAIAQRPRYLILDEPTASLTNDAVKQLFYLLTQLRHEDVGIIYISHRLQEIFAIADHVTVLRDGTYQGTFEKAGLTRELLIRKMVGREPINTPMTKSIVEQSVALEVQNLSSSKLTDISFTIRKGEIVGFAGLAGAGRTEIARAIFGADPSTGKTLVNGKQASIQHPADAIACSIGYVPEERKTMALFMDMSISENVACVTMNSSKETFYDRKNYDNKARLYLQKLRINASSVEQPVKQLSGGNQQKIVLSKWILKDPDILLVDEPTHGVDVGAKSEIYELLKKLAYEGKAIMFISSELPELIAVCNRIIVLKNGRIAGELLASEATEEQLLALAT